MNRLNQFESTIFLTIFPKDPHFRLFDSVILKWKSKNVQANEHALKIGIHVGSMSRYSRDSEISISASFRV